MNLKKAIEAYEEAELGGPRLRHNHLLDDIPFREVGEMGHFIKIESSLPDAIWRQLPVRDVESPKLPTPGSWHFVAGFLCASAYFLFLAWCFR